VLSAKVRMLFKYFFKRGCFFGMLDYVCIISPIYGVVNRQRVKSALWTNILFKILQLNLKLFRLGATF
jgi:hypothetical protein